MGTLTPEYQAKPATIRSQQPAQFEREAMYYRYLEFASYVKGSSIEPLTGTQDRNQGEC